MKAWKRWRDKHWTKIKHEGVNEPGWWAPDWEESPPIRCTVERLCKQIQDKPLEAIALLVAALGLIVTIIQLVR